MENPPDLSGQRLRWWQDDAPKTQKWYSEPSPVPVQTTSIPLAPPVLDLEDELEAEALRRAALERDAVLLEGSFANAEPKAFRNFAWIVVPASLFYLAMAALTQHWFLALFPLVFVAEFFLLRSVMRKKFANKKSHIQMSSLGLTVDLPYYRLGPVFWDEIASVSVVNWGITRYVRVKLKDPKKTHKRALTIKPGKMSWMARTSLNMTHIEIVDQWFPESAQEIAARIATFHPASSSRE
jgi:hypothetical protein